MKNSKTRLELAELARTTLTLYQEAVAQKAREEALFHAVDEEIRSQVAVMSDDLPADVAEEKLQALCALFARRNRHGIACNEAIDIATRAHAQLMVILERSGLDRSWLDEAAPPLPSIH